MRPQDKAEIARRFKTLRRHASLTQRCLAGIIGICRQAVSDIENKKTLPHDRTWLRFAILEGKLLADHVPPYPAAFGNDFSQPDKTRPCEHDKRERFPVLVFFGLALRSDSEATNLLRANCSSVQANG
jgi:DNA-binding XRE family transcriptional regulator